MGDTPFSMAAVSTTVWAFLMLIGVRLRMCRSGYGNFVINQYGDGDYHPVDSQDFRNAISNQEEIEQIQQANAAIERAARWLPGSTCLIKSLGLKLLLEKSQIRCSLRVGVRRDPSGFKAHAWIEHQGVCINFTPEMVSNYAPLRS